MQFGVTIFQERKVQEWGPHKEALGIGSHRSQRGSTSLEKTTTDYVEKRIGTTVSSLGEKARNITTLLDQLCLLEDFWRPKDVRHQRRGQPRRVAIFEVGGQRKKDVSRHPVKLYPRSNLPSGDHKRGRTEEVGRGNP